jgi:hypothetical protein
MRDASWVVAALTVPVADVSDMCNLAGAASSCSELFRAARSDCERIDIGLGDIDTKKRKLSERSGRVFARTNRAQRVSDMRGFVV